MRILIQSAPINMGLKDDLESFLISILKGSIVHHAIQSEIYNSTLLTLLTLLSMNKSKRECRQSLAYIYAQHFVCFHLFYVIFLKSRNEWTHFSFVYFFFICNIYIFIKPLNSSNRLSSTIGGNREMDQLYTTSEVSNITKKTKFSHISRLVF